MIDTKNSMNNDLPLCPNNTGSTMQNSSYISFSSCPDGTSGSQNSPDSKGGSNNLNPGPKMGVGLDLIIYVG